MKKSVFNVGFIILLVVSVLLWFGYRLIHDFLSNFDLSVNDYVFVFDYTYLTIAYLVPSVYLLFRRKHAVYLLSVLLIPIIMVYVFQYCGYNFLLRNAVHFIVGYIVFKILDTTYNKIQENKALKDLEDISDFELQKIIQNCKDSFTIKNKKANTLLDEPSTLLKLKGREFDVEKLDKVKCVMTKKVKDVKYLAFRSSKLSFVYKVEAKKIEVYKLLGPYIEIYATQIEQLLNKLK